METVVPQLPAFDEDFRFTERCLAGDSAAIADLRRNRLDLVHSYIVRAGASASESLGIIEALFADCLVSASDARPVLASFLGQCPLQPWLCRVALNRFLALKRASQRDRERFGTAPGDAQLANLPDTGGDLNDEPALGLVRDAIIHAFMECEPEQFVILQLLHSDELTEAEIARMFGCAISTVSRQADRARETIRRVMIEHVRASDPLLELTFDDLLAICRTVLPDCFGVE